MKTIFILLLSPLLAYAMPTEPVSPITNEYGILPIDPILPIDHPDPGESQEAG